MRLFLFALLGLLNFFATAAFAGDAVGYRALNIADPSGSRPLDIGLWYPTGDHNPPQILAENKAFIGTEVIFNASPMAGSRPLVVLSHGYGGSWRNLNWLAVELAAQGYIVAAPDHPGTTTMDKDPVEAAKLWERPHDLSRAIDTALANPGLVGLIDSQRIAAIGHSFGGWTVTALGGGRFSAALLQVSCQTKPTLAPCHLLPGIGVMPSQPNQADNDLRDPRVKAIVSLDLGMARGFTPESLETYPTPTLIIAAGTEIVPVPARYESGYLATYLPATNSRLYYIPDATHFSFMQLCQPNGMAIVEAESPGEGFVCQDGGTRSRAAIHDEVAQQISSFLSTAIPAN